MGKTERIFKAFVLASISVILATGMLCCICVADENSSSILTGTRRETVSFDKNGKNPFAFITDMW